MSVNINSFSVNVSAKDVLIFTNIVVNTLVFTFMKLYHCAYRVRRTRTLGLINIDGVPFP